jgi:GntR family transcriptional repressor for pyruvate dehydrogenase complex
LQELIEAATAKLVDIDGFTRLSRDFHRAVAEASHNRVLVFQLVSLQHVSWPRRNRTLTRDVAEHVLATHRELLRLIAAGDSEGARALMRDHVTMIRARRVAEEQGERACC